MQNVNKKLITGTVVYMIGNATSKVLQLLLLPIITALLLTDEYGYYDLVTSTVSLVLPIITLQSTEAVFKFLFKAEEREKSIIVSTVLLFLCGSILFFGILMFAFNKFTSFIQFPVLIFLHYSTFTIYIFYQKIARSTQKNVPFAISGVLHTFALIGVELLLLIVFKMRVDGLLIANVISNLVCIVYLEYVVRASGMISLKNVKLNVLRSVLKFSTPLVPNSISWWFVKACNTYFVTIFMGIGYNGIYSVANKFPQLLTFITSVFQMAWQESAIMESDSETRNHFYSSVFNSYIKFLFTSMVAVLPLIKIFMPYLVDERYLSGIVCIPILLTGVVFASLSQFYGVGYLAFNKTKDALSTTVVAAIINCTCCIALIPFIGLLAPAIGTMLAYCVQWVYRMFQMRRYFKLHIKWNEFALYVSIAVVYILLFYIIENIYIHVVLFMIASVIFLFANKVLIREMLQKILRRTIQNGFKQ